MTQAIEALIYALRMIVNDGIDYSQEPPQFSMDHPDTQKTINEYKDAINVLEIHAGLPATPKEDIDKEFIESHRAFLQKCLDWKRQP